MTALHRALAFAEVNQVAVLVAEHLDFDVARVLDQLLDVNAAVAKGAQSFARGGFGGGGEIFGTIHAAHAFAAASRHGFEHDGIAGARRSARSSRGSRNNGRAAASAATRRASVFDPINAMDRAEGPMKTKPASPQAWAKRAFSLRKP